MAEMYALQRSEQASPSAFQCQFRQHLSLLYGGETFLWSDFIARAAIRASEANPVLCLACQETAHEIPQMIPAFLDHFMTMTPFEESAEQGALSLCSWHALWLFNQSARQPAIFSRLEPVLRSTCNSLVQQVGDRNMQRQPCHLCAWLNEQERLLAEKLHRQLGDPLQQIQLCLPHARAVLRQSRDEETQQAVALALLRSVSQVGKRLEGYVHNCTERFQDHMQPDERVAWFDAIRWFGGSESAQFLLTSTSTTETSGE